MSFIRLIMAGIFMMLATQAYAQQPPSGAVQIGQGAALPQWLAMGGDCALAANGSITCTKTNGTLFTSLFLQAANNLSDLNSASTARTNLGLGSVATQNANAVAFTGGTITGMPLPSLSGDVANKQYVDNFTSAALTVHSSVALGTTTALPANTYNNGSSGVGATLTSTCVSSCPAPTIDGSAVTLGQRVLVKDEAAPTNNGIYTVTTVGTGTTPYVLTRATDANTAGTANPTLIGYGTYTLVLGGTVNINNGWTVNSTVTTIGTSAINWAQFNTIGGVSEQKNTAGAGLTTSGNCDNVGTNAGSPCQTALSLTNAFLQANPSAPSGTTSGGGVMMGLGSACHITPSYSGRLSITVNGDAKNNTSGDSVILNLYTGSGTAPTNGAATIGTKLSNNLSLGGGTNASVLFGFSATGIIGGLSPGTPYWIDLELAALGGGAFVQNITCSAMEF